MAIIPTSLREALTAGMSGALAELGSAYAAINRITAEIGGQELAFAAITSSLPAMAADADNVQSGLSVTFVSDGSPTIASFEGVLSSSFSALFVPHIKIWDGPVGTGILLVDWAETITSGSQVKTVLRSVRWTPAVGTRTLNVSLRTAASQSAQLFATATSPAALSVRKA